MLKATHQQWYKGAADSLVMPPYLWHMWLILALSTRNAKTQTPGLLLATARTLNPIHEMFNEYPSIWCCTLPARRYSMISLLIADIIWSDRPAKHKDRHITTGFYTV